jgi:Ser/Thr protein kinase RdoA (MazF antagonist)
MLSKQKFSQAALRKILSNFDLGEIKTIKPIPTSGNIAYLIQTKNKKYFLRLSPLGARSRSKQDIAAEIELLEYLADNNFPVSRPVADKTGEKIIAWQKHHGYLRNYISGVEKKKPTLKEIEKFGFLLGEFHKLVENYQTKNRRQHVWDPKATKAYFLSIKKSLDKQFRDEFEDQLLCLRFSQQLPAGSIHEDLGKRHVIWQGDKIVTVLDFDRFYFAPLIFDLGQAIRGWCFINHWQNWNQANFKALISAYQKQRPLATAEKKCLVDSIKFAVLERALSFYSRYLHVTKDQADLDYAWLSLKRLIPILEKEKDKIEGCLKNKKAAL